MSGFRAFILRGNLVELAVAFIIGAAFASLVTAFTEMLMGFIGKIGGQPDFGAVEVAGVNVGQFINALVSFLIIAAVVYFFVVMPYTKAKEKFFPQRRARRHSRGRRAAHRDPRRAAWRGGRRHQHAGRPRLTDQRYPWCGGTLLRSHSSAASLEGSCGLSGSRSSRVDSGSTSPNTSARRRRRSSSDRSGTSCSGPVTASPPAPAPTPSARRGRTRVDAAPSRSPG